PGNRTYNIRTIAHPSSRLKDLYITNVKNLMSHSNVNGDEATAIIRTGSRGIVAFIEGRPFIVGVFTPDSNDSLANAQSVSQTGPSSYQGITNPNAII